MKCGRGLKISCALCVRYYNRTPPSRNPASATAPPVTIHQLIISLSINNVLSCMVVLYTCATMQVVVSTWRLTQIRAATYTQYAFSLRWPVIQALIQKYSVGVADWVAIATCTILSYLAAWVWYVALTTSDILPHRLMMYMPLVHDPGISMVIVLLCALIRSLHTSEFRPL